MRNPASLRGVLGQILQREAPLTFAVSVAYNSDFSALSKQPLRPEGLGAVCEEFLNFRGGPCIFQLGVFRNLRVALAFKMHGARLTLLCENKELSHKDIRAHLERRFHALGSRTTSQPILSVDRRGGSTRAKNAAPAL